MTKFISVKVFRGTFPNEERLGKFAGQPGACLNIIVLSARKMLKKYTNT